MVQAHLVTYLKPSVGESRKSKKMYFAFDSTKSDRNLLTNTARFEEVIFSSDVHTVFFITSGGIVGGRLWICSLLVITMILQHGLRGCFVYDFEV